MSSGHSFLTSGEASETSLLLQFSSTISSVFSIHWDYVDECGSFFSLIYRNGREVEFIGEQYLFVTQKLGRILVTSPLG